jgi:hypothetical protein
MASNTSSYVATAVVVVLAVGAAVFAGITLAQENQEEQSFTHELAEAYVPSDGLMDTMQDNAERLIRNDYEILKLLFIEGLPHLDEPYGNLPEDGIYVVDSEKSKYTQLQQITDLVNQTFTREEAAKLLTDPLGDGYPVYYDKGGKLGIRYDFEPEADYNVGWQSPAYVVTPLSDTECTLKVTLLKDGEPFEQECSMLCLNGVWLLDKLIR